jgi:hypothetical protein
MQEGGGSSKDQDICAQFPKACDQAEDACEKKHHQECVCHYHSDHDKDDVSPIHPDADDFKCHPVGNKCKDAGCHDKEMGMEAGTERVMETGTERVTETGTAMGMATTTATTEPSLFEPGLKRCPRR